MTMIRPKIIRCSVCGKESEQWIFITLDFDFGDPAKTDLDGRRHGIDNGPAIMKCPFCGYLAEDLENKTNISLGFIMSDTYQKCDLSEELNKIGESKNHNLNSTALQMALISLHTKNYAQAYYDFLHAAWTEDDKKKVKEARICRLLALSQMDKFPQDKDPFNIFSQVHFSDSYFSQLSERPNKFNSLSPSRIEDIQLIKADLLRRTSQFERVIAEFQDRKFEKPIVKHIINFQIERAKKHDDKRYRYKDALKNSGLVHTDR